MQTFIERRSPGWVSVSSLMDDFTSMILSGSYCSYEQVIDAMYFIRMDGAVDGVAQQIAVQCNAKPATAWN
jgi:hypothetical protein